MSVVRGDGEGGKVVVPDVLHHMPRGDHNEDAPSAEASAEQSMKRMWGSPRRGIGRRRHGGGNLVTATTPS